MTSSSTVSVRSLPFWWRVTRYDPTHRDEGGAFRDHTWTSISDVGNIFENRELTIDEYTVVETAYVDAFVGFAEDGDVTSLEIRYLEHGDGLEDRAQVSVADAADIVRRMLREEIVCRLESPADHFAVHVGFDLYMYVGSAYPCVRAVQRARDLGLFVEGDWPSPQLVDVG